MPRLKTENWYIVLELEFDPPVEDEKIISSRITEKKDFWNKNANSFQRGKQYCAWRDAIPRMQKEMLGENNIRKQLAKEACEIVYGEVDEMLSDIGLKGNITETEVANIVKNLKSTEDIVKKRAKALKIPIIKESDPKFDFNEIYDKYYKKAPESAKSYLSLPKLLDIVGKKNLYDFLYGSDTKADRVDAATLKAKAIEKRKEFIHNNQVDSAGKSLCGQCEIAFNNETSKKGYDEYLIYISCKQVLDRLKKIAAIANNSIVWNQARNYIDQLTELYRDADLAESIVVSFCEMEKIKYSQGSKDEKPTKKCLCGFRNDASRSVCSHCGLPLEIKCPKCGKKNPVDAEFCNCGFDMKNIQRSNQLCDIARAELDKMNVDAAELHLNQAESAWKENPKIEALRRDIKKVGEGFRRELKNLKLLISEKKFFAADAAYAALKRSFSYVDSFIETQIKDAKSEAETLFKKAKSQLNKDEAILSCNNALNICKDYPGIQEYIAQNFAPDAPMLLKVSCDSVNNVNIISWTPRDKSVGIRYKVIKKLNSSPSNVNDGEEVAVVSMCSVTDKNVSAGAAYYYAVYAEKAGTYSKTGLISREPAINLFELSGVSVSVGDKSLELLWKKAPANTKIHVYMLDVKGTPKEIKTLDNNHSSCVVSGLVNGNEYKFRLSVEYLINGKKCVTGGVEINGVPVQPPKPVETLSVQFVKDDEFSVNWTHFGRGEVRFYRSPTAPNYKSGDVVPLADIEKKMSRVMLQSQSKVGAADSGQFKGTFKHFSKEKIYISAVTVESGAAVFGIAVQTAKVGVVSIIKVREISGSIFINIKVPENATAFNVLYSFDGMPVSPDDKNCLKRYINMNEYLSKGALVLPNAQAKKYYIGVSSEYKDGNLTTNSALATTIFNNVGKLQVKYSINPKRVFFSKSVEIVIDFEKGIDLLPDIDFVGRIRALPMEQNQDGVFVLFGIRNGGKSIQEGTVKAGSIKLKKSANQLIINIPEPKDKDMNIRPFIVDLSMAEQAELMLSGGDYKIS